MPVQTVGDMSAHFQSLRQTGQIKSDLVRLSTELSTQQKSDLTSHLQGRTEQLSSLDREINLLESFGQSAAEVGQRLGFMQSTLGVIDALREGLASQALPISSESTEAAIADAAEGGTDLFSELVVNLNKRIGDRALFSGSTTDQDPLAPASDMMSSIQVAINGLTSVTDISAAIEDWFEDPAGGFATMGYLGAQGAYDDQKIGPTLTISNSTRADDQAVRDLLKGAALVAVAKDDSDQLTKATRAELVKLGGQELYGASESLAVMRGSLGHAEARIEEALVAQSTQLTAYLINRNDMTVADPFETASRLQDVQQQLEMHYTVTARLSQLSLVNYLR